MAMRARRSQRAPAFDGRAWHGSKLVLLEVNEGLDELLAGVHHKRAVARDGLTQGFAGQQQQACGILPRAKHNAIAGAQHAQFLGADQPLGIPANARGSLKEAWRPTTPHGREGLILAPCKA